MHPIIHADAALRYLWIGLEPVLYAIVTALALVWCIAVLRCQWQESRERHWWREVQRARREPVLTDAQVLAIEQTGRVEYEEAA